MEIELLSNQFRPVKKWGGVVHHIAVIFKARLQFFWGGKGKKFDLTTTYKPYAKLPSCPPAIVAPEYNSCGLSEAAVVRCCCFFMTNGGVTPLLLV